jgi:hypothetical protein
MRLAILAAVSGLAFLVPAKAADAEGAADRHLSLGEVAVVQSSATGLTSALRSALQSEMRELDLRGAHKDAILSVSLVDMETDKAQATCVISATLRSRSGVLFAVLEGRARAQGGSAHVPESALRGAVHGALSRIPDALK